MKSGSYDFNASGHIDEAGTFVEEAETITIPTVEEIVAEAS